MSRLPQMGHPLGRLSAMSAEKTEQSQSGAVDRGQILLIALVVLALVASVIMLITDSNSFLKLALLSALWAAIIGFFLVFSYRRKAEQSQEQLEHERELHAAETAKAEAEAKAEREETARKQQDSERTAESETLVKIQEELAELRANLEAMSGRDLGYEPAALRAQARRIMELEAETGDEDRGPQVKGAPSAAAVTGLLGQIPKEPMRPEPTPEEFDEPEQPEEQKEPEAAPAAPEPAEATAQTRTFNTGGFTSVKWDQVGARHVADATPSAEPKPKPTPEPEPEAEPEQEAPEQSRGRRRQDERSGAVSVADLMANLRKNKE